MWMEKARFLLKERCLGIHPIRGVSMKRFRNYLQHRLNPVHMYCRLVDFGLASVSARRVCSVYERFIYKALLFH